MTQKNKEIMNDFLFNQSLSNFGWSTLRALRWLLTGLRAKPLTVS